MGRHPAVRHDTDQLTLGREHDCRDIATQIGWTPDKVRITTGSVGALESTVELEVSIEDLSALDAAWSKLGTIEAHKKWGKDIESYIVSGTPRWEIYRVV